MNDQKPTHKLTPQEQKKIIEYAKTLPDTAESTRMIRDKFNVTGSISRYYRRRAHGYMGTGAKRLLPVPVSVPAETVKQLDQMIRNGWAETRAHAVETAVELWYKSPSRRKPAETIE